MKIRIIFFFILSLLILSCKTNNSVGKESIIELNPFSKKDYYEYIDKSSYHIGNDSFRAVLYSNVKPLKENKNIPQKIFTYESYYNDSKKYFTEELNGKSISFLERNKKIVFRHFFQDYKDIIPNDNNPKNKADVINYLNKNKVKYKLIRSYNKLGSDILDFDINDQFLRVVATSAFCESYSCYNLKDSINIKNYRTIIANFYR